MQAETTGANAPAPDAYVCVTRDLIDDRTVMVPLAAVKNPHMATDCGGRMAALPHPALAVYVNCEWIHRTGRPFGHSHSHSGRCQPIKVLVQDHSTDDETLRHLLKRAEGFKPKKGRKGPRRPE